VKPNRGNNFFGLRYRCLGQRSLAPVGDAGSDRNPTYEKLAL